MSKETQRNHIILAPIITAKSTELAAKKCFTFLVSAKANKFQIAQAFEELFEAKPSKINTTAKRAKLKRTKKGYVRKADMKKAYIQADVELKELFPQM